MHFTSFTSFLLTALFASAITAKFVARSLPDGLTYARHVYRDVNGLAMVTDSTPQETCGKGHDVCDDGWCCRYPYKCFGTLFGIQVCYNPNGFHGTGKYALPYDDFGGKIASLNSRILALKTGSRPDIEPSYLGAPRTSDTDSEAPSGHPKATGESQTLETTSSLAVETSSAPIAETTSTSIVEVTPTSIVETASTPFAETTSTPYVETTSTPYVETTSIPYVETTSTPFAETASTPYDETKTAPHQTIILGVPCSIHLGCSRGFRYTANVALIIWELATVGGVLVIFL